MAAGSIAFQILFPSPYSLELSKLRQQLEEAHFAWAREWRRQQDEFKIENIRFEHDPCWNRRIFSLQAARNGEVWFWQVTRMIVTFAGLSI
jgi:hypothetical protein